MKNEFQYGVISHQGDFCLHEQIMRRLSRKTIKVLTGEDLEKSDALIMPGGESTTLIRFFDRLSLWEILDKKIRESTPIFCTCAGLILLARNITNPAQKSLGVIDIDIERNGYGRQVESFEAKIESRMFNGKPLNGIFIRAPRITRIGPDVEVLARVDGDPVLVKSGKIIGAIFHPELEGDTRVHSFFINMAEGGQ